MTFVTLDIIRKTMEKHQRCIFYIYGSNKELLHASEDCKNVDEAFAELEEYISGCIGSYVVVELPKEGRGKSSRGGNKLTVEEAKYSYAVKLSNGNTPRNEASAGGSMGLILQMMKENRDLMVQMEKERSERNYEKLRDEIKEVKSKKGDSGIDKFADLILRKYQEAERVKGIAREVTTKHQPQPQPEPAGAMAEEVKPNPMKEKLKGAINTFKEVDENYIDNMAFLAEYAKKNPEIYKEFIAGLKGAEV